MVVKRSCQTPPAQGTPPASSPDETPERELRRRVQQLEQQLAERDEFIATLGHELRNPVSPVMLQTRHLLDRAAEAEDGVIRAEWLTPRLEALLQRAQRFLTTLERLLDVSHLGGAGPALELEDVDLGDVLREVAAGLQRELAVSRCELSLRTPGTVVGRWDRLRVEQIVCNLLTNAIRYGAGHPVEATVEVTAEDALGPARARLVVTDHGIGIAAEEQGRIFDRYHRAPAARRAGGLGLGLWIVRRLCEALGGDVRVDSGLGEGATFLVTLPLQGPRSS